MVDSFHHLGRIGDRGGTPIAAAGSGFDFATVGHGPFQWHDPNQFLPALPGEGLDLFEFEDTTNTGGHFGSGRQLLHLNDLEIEVALQAGSVEHRHLGLRR